MPRNPTHVPEALSTAQTTCALGRPHPGTKCCHYCSRVQHGPGEPQHPRMSKRDLWHDGSACRHLRGDEARWVGTEETLANLPIRKHLVPLRVVRRDDHSKAAQLGSEHRRTAHARAIQSRSPRP